MIGCAVSLDLARYERDEDIAEGRAAFICEEIELHLDETKKRLLRIPYWIGEAVCGNDAVQAAFAAAAGAADDGDHEKCARIIREALDGPADEEARQMINDHCEDADPRVLHRVRDVDYLNWSKWEQR